MAEEGSPVPGPTTFRSKKLFVVLLVDALATVAYYKTNSTYVEFGSASSEASVAIAPMLDMLFATYLNFLGLFNAAYAAINTGQKWALK